MSAILLRACYAMPGTGIAYVISLRACYAISGTDIAYGASSPCAFATRCPRMVLCACYAMSSTEIAYGAIPLRACYATSGTEIAYDASCLRTCYAVPGTERRYMLVLAYGRATRCPVLREITWDVGLLSRQKKREQWILSLNLHEIFAEELNTDSFDSLGGLLGLESQ
eukprot:3941208-Rhodomonas_salina.2